jgi:hypothetical protein
MIYTIEIAQTFSSEKTIKQELFFKSMLSSFQQAVSFLIENGILHDFKSRVVDIKDQAIKQDWFNSYEFNAIIERFEY